MINNDVTLLAYANLASPVDLSFHGSSLPNVIANEVKDMPMQAKLNCCCIRVNIFVIYPCYGIKSI